MYVISWGGACGWGWWMVYAQPVGILAQGCAPDPDFPTHPRGPQEMKGFCFKMILELSGGSWSAAPLYRL